MVSAGFECAKITRLFRAQRSNSLNSLLANLDEPYHRLGRRETLRINETKRIAANIAAPVQAATESDGVHREVAPRARVVLPIPVLELFEIDRRLPFACLPFASAAKRLCKFRITLP